MQTQFEKSMAAVNWFCLVLAFAFIKIYVCIKIDPSDMPNGNYTTTSLSSQTLQPYPIRNETSNSTLLGDSELSASERTRRLIPYMAFYVPVAELPINKQYVSKNNAHTTKQLLARPSATGVGSGPASVHIPTPQQYVHSGMQLLPPAAAATLSTDGQQHYHTSAGLNVYHAHSYGGQQPQQQQQYHLLPPTTGHSQLLHPPGPPGPSAAAVSTLVARGKGNGNNHNAFVPHKEFHPLRQKTVQYFPPLSSTAASATASSSSSASATAFEASYTKHQQNAHHHHGVNDNSVTSSGGVGFGVGVGYRPRTKQSKINLTPFTPSNTVPGNFVPIVYTPLNNNNNILNSHNAGEEVIDDTSFNQDENQQYHKQQQQQQQQLLLQPQQIGLEYSSGPLPSSSSGSADSIIPLDVPQRHHNNQLQQQQQQQLQQQQQPQQKYHAQNSQQQAQYYDSVTTSPLNVEGAGVSVNLAHHSHHNAGEAISSPTIYHQNQHQQQHQHHHHHLQNHHQQPLQTEHVIADTSLRTSQQPQTITVIGPQHQQQQQLIHGGNSAIHFQPPKPERFFESEIQLQQHQHQHQHQHQQQQQHQRQQQHNIDQVLKDVNSYSLKNSQMLTPQEKYVMYLQQRIRYNKHQQRHHATRHKYSEHNNNHNNNDKEHEENPTQIFLLSSTVSPAVHGGSITALAPMRASQYDTNFPQHSPIHHDLYSRPILKPTVGVGSQDDEIEEQVLTIPVHSLFSGMETLQQQKHNHFSQYHSTSKHKSKYSKNGPAKPEYIDYPIDEPKQSLDDEQHQHQVKPQQNLELLKPTLGPPTHAFILVTTGAPFQLDSVAQDNYGSSLKPPYKSKPKIRLQPAVKQKNVNYPTIGERNPTERLPQIVSITPTTKSYQYNEDDGKPKYVYVKEEFGQKLTTVAGDGAVKLKSFNKYESDDNQIPQKQLTQHQQYQDQNQPLTPQNHNHHQSDTQANVPFAPPKTILADPNELPDIRTSSLAEILHKLQESNHLPHTLTPDNIDNSIKTLIRILNNLKQTQTIVANPPQHHEIPDHSHPSSPDYDYTGANEENQQPPQPHDLSLLTPTGPNKHPGPSTGRPGIDYPNYADIPQTSFDCSQQRYKGFFGDPETSCQVWHYCDLNGGKASFLCPNGTIFSQIALTCDWWFNVKCATTPQLYVLNERLYKYILPFTPKFPEDYSGPLVDKYLAMKFQEMEEKMRLEKEKALQKAEEEEEEEEEEDDDDNETVTETEQPIETDSEDNHLEKNSTVANNVNRHIKSHPPAKHHKPESVNSQVSEQSSERNLLIDDEVDDISQRGTVDNFESTTIATQTATKKSDIISFSLRPIIVSSTMGPDYNDDDHENEKRSHEKSMDNVADKKTDTEITVGNDNRDLGVATERATVPLETTLSPSKMQITVEKVNVIEIKPDEATGHIIRDMILNSKQTK